jgi:hypothetical protein
MELLAFPDVDFICEPDPLIGFLASAVQVMLADVLLSMTQTFPVKSVPLSYMGHWTVIFTAVLFQILPFER